jgi:gamma-glutamyltranspeptidase/glutathione hydrolase
LLVSPASSARINIAQHPIQRRNRSKILETMLQPMRLGLLAILSLLLIVTHLPRASTSPLEFSEQDDGSHGHIAPGKLGAVASESSICSKHGTDILKMGGNAADAVGVFGLRANVDLVDYC